MLKHLVIFVYIAELVAFAMLLSGRMQRKPSLRGNPAAAVCAVMLVRILIKLVYFYVEYYVFPWHLDILFNMLMDITYVASVAVVLEYAVHILGEPLLRGRMLQVASAIYVVGLALVSLAWADRASNHVIVVPSGLPMVLAIAVEVVFAASVIISCASILQSGGEETASGQAKGLAIAAALYALYMFAWDVSLFVWSGGFLQSMKPFDGVLVFGAVIAYLLFTLRGQEEAEPSGGETVPQSAPAVQDPAALIESFSQQYGLTAREKDVVELLFQGLNTAQVAEKLVVSVNTVRRHAYNIYRKAGVSNRYELLYKAHHPEEQIMPPTSGNAAE